MRKHKDLTVVLALLRQVANDPTLERDHRGVLLSVARELRKLQRFGPLPNPEVYRVVRKVAEALWKATAKQDGDAER